MKKLMFAFGCVALSAMLFTVTGCTETKKNEEDQGRRRPKKTKDQGRQDDRDQEGRDQVRDQDRQGQEGLK